MIEGLAACFTGLGDLHETSRCCSARRLCRLKPLPEAAAQTPVYLAQDPQAVGTGGRFYGPQLVPSPGARSGRTGVVCSGRPVKTSCVPTFKGQQRWKISRARLRAHL